MALEPIIDPAKLNSSKSAFGVPSQKEWIGNLYQETAYCLLAQRSTRARLAEIDEDTMPDVHAVRRPGTLKLAVVYGHDAVRHAHDVEGAGFVHVKIHDVRSIAEEALLMTVLHRSAPRLNDTQQHVLAVSWHEPIALLVEEVLNAEGLTALPLHARPGRPDLRQVKAISALRYAWGDKGRLNAHFILTKDELKKGTNVLRWLVKSLLGLVNAGQPINLVYRKATIRALAWIGRNGTAVPSAAKMQKLLAPLTLPEIAYAVLDKEYKNSRASVWAHNLRDVLNTLAGTPLVKIPALTKP